MIKIKVKTTWQGMVGIRDKYLKQAIRDKDGLVISVNGEEMIVDHNEIKTRIKSKSEKPFFDRFSNESHWLYYYDWKPTSPKLF